MEVNTNGNQCMVTSPEGQICTKVAKHKSPECKNGWSGKVWCGDCMEWTCKHVPVGQS